MLLIFHCALVSIGSFLPPKSQVFHTLAFLWNLTFWAQLEKDAPSNKQNSCDWAMDTHNTCVLQESRALRPSLIAWYAGLSHLFVVSSNRKRTCSLWHTLEKVGHHFVAFASPLAQLRRRPTSLLAFFYEKRIMNYESGVQQCGPF